MADIKQIDKFFNGERPFEDRAVRSLSQKERLVRAIKLIMPSLAAVLIGLIVLYPSLKQDDVVADLNVTLPKKGELEKLHIENTEISITDKDNKVSQIFADQVDETTPGSKLMKIINPQGELPAGSKDERVKVSSDIGYYNQQANTLKVENNVKAVYTDGTTAQTQEAFYDFNKAMGNGEKDVYAKGDWGELWAEGFAYHQDKEILILKGKSKLKNEEQTLTADKELRYYRLENRVEADNNVHLQDKESKLRSDFLKAYLREGGKLEFEHMEALGSVKIINADNTMYADKAKAYFEGSDISQMQAEGHVKVVNKQNTLTADRATADFIKGEISKVRAYDKVKVIDDKNTLYADKATAFLQGRDITKIEANDNVKIIDKDRDMQADRMVAYFAAGSKGKIEKIEAFGNVKIVTPDGFVQGEYGIYTPLQDEVEIHKNVVISKDGSVIKGDKAVTNLETSVSRVYMDSANKRVSGVITGSTIKGGTDEKEQ